MEDNHELTAYIMSPHVVSVSPHSMVQNAAIGEEAKGPGFNRVVERVVCSCGEEFHKEADGHGDQLLDLARAHAY
jgi:hypothetical protein